MTYRDPPLRFADARLTHVRNVEEGGSSSSLTYLLPSLTQGTMGTPEAAERQPASQRAPRRAHRRATGRDGTSGEGLSAIVFEAEDAIKFGDASRRHLQPISDLGPGLVIGLLV